jgi:hypothetical protein
MPPYLRPTACSRLEVRCLRGIVLSSLFVLALCSNEGQKYLKALQWDVNIVSMDWLMQMYTKWMLLPDTDFLDKRLVEMRRQVSGLQDDVTGTLRHSLSSAFYLCARMTCSYDDTCNLSEAGGHGSWAAPCDVG